MTQALCGVVVGGEILPLSPDDGPPASPMEYMKGSCTQQERDILTRWYEAQQLASGNRVVSFHSGVPRGRYAAFALRGVPFETYMNFEVSAYRWIIKRYMRGGVADQAEYFARMESGETEHSFVDWGALVSNSDDPLIAYGAAVGSTRALAWVLLREYEIYSEIHKQRQAALRAGKTASAADARASRTLAVAGAIDGHVLAKNGNSR